MTQGVRNPRTGAIDYHYEEPSAAAIEQLVTQLRGAQTDWHQRGIEARIEALQQWKSHLTTHRTSIEDALTVDTGRYTESVLEVNILLNSIDRWCGLARSFFAPQSDKPSAIPFIHIRQAVQPYEVVGVISPWNFPLLLSIIDALPALLAGCAVVVKPSEVTPRFLEPLMATIRAVPALSPVLAYVPGAGAVGQALVDFTDLICFTGSVATGQKVYAACAARFKPCFLELGGKDPALVFEGADIDLAARSILWGSTVNCGHSCLSIERVYVEASIFDAFVQTLVRYAEQVTLSYDAPTAGHLGPIIAERQAAIIDEHLADALAKGAVRRTGNAQCERRNGAYWCRPTVLTHVRQDMKVLTDETFGPIIPVMPFQNEEEAIALANETVFGLSAAVFAGTEEKAVEIGQRLQVGAISINDCALTAVVHEGEKNAFKQSGLGGTRMGAGAMRRFVRQQAFLLKKEPIASPWWFQEKAQA